MTGKIGIGPGGCGGLHRDFDGDQALCGKAPEYITRRNLAVAGTAIGVTTVMSFSGGLIGILALAAPFVSDFALSFQPCDYMLLAARFDLGEGLLTRLKAGNILYDEDATGAFFQFYSRPCAGGMFFEIVERRGGYNGYGAPNAPFRIAAQKRLMRHKGVPKQ